LGDLFVTQSHLFAATRRSPDLSYASTGESAYRLVEFAEDGSRRIEFFNAPSGEVAVARALEASEAQIFEVWDAHRLVGRVQRPAAS
jgi:hypothetical protein